MDLSILIISYDTRELTLACLESVYAQTRATSFEVILLDNASTDGSPVAIAERFPQVRLLCEEENRGFAVGNNIVARQAAGEYLLLLNPDTVILDGAIDKAVAFARARPAPAIVGGRTYFGDGRLNASSCHGCPTLWSTLCLGLGLSSVFRGWRLLDPESLGPWPRDTVREVPAVTGCFLLILRSAWEQLGGFDEAFFMYAEETDLCIRARALGVPSLICPDARLIHYGGRSEKVRTDKMVRLFASKVRLLEKHWPRGWVWFGVMMLKLWAFDRMVVLGLLQCFRPSFRSAYQGWRDIWRRRVEYSVTSPMRLQEAKHG